MTRPTQSLKFAGTVLIQASRGNVWSFLTDPTRLSACVPGLQTLQIVEPGRRFSGEIIYLFGKRRLKVPAEVAWRNLNRPDSAGLLAQTTLADHKIEAASEVALIGAPDGPTELHWSANVTSSIFTDNDGRFLRPVVKNLAQKLITSFLTCLKEKLEDKSAPLEKRQKLLPPDETP